jgi:hypothetical protein
MENVFWGVLSLIVYIGCPCLLLYWMRTMPRNKGGQHGGGFNGAGAAFGYPPLGNNLEVPRKPRSFPLESDPKDQPNH